MRTGRDLPPLLPPALAALTTGALLLWANLRPRLGQVVTGDDGVWPGSWTLRFGWPWDFYQSFGYDPGSGGAYCWIMEGLLKDVALGTVLVSALFFGVLAFAGFRISPTPDIPTPRSAS